MVASHNIDAWGPAWVEFSMSQSTRSLGEGKMVQEHDFR